MNINYSLKDVQDAFKKFNDLPFAETSRSPEMYKIREAAWRDYCLKRDYYLLGLKTIPVEDIHFHSKSQH